MINFPFSKLDMLEILAGRTAVEYRLSADDGDHLRAEQVGDVGGEIVRIVRGGKNIHFD